MGSAGPLSPCIIPEVIRARVGWIQVGVGAVAVGVGKVRTLDLFTASENPPSAPLA